MKRAKRSKRGGRTYRSEAKAARMASSKNADASQPGSVPDFVLLPNAHDQFAIDRLRSVPVGGLEVDLLVENDPKLALLWQIYSRCVLAQICFRQCGHRCGGGRAMSATMA